MGCEHGMSTPVRIEWVDIVQKTCKDGEPVRCAKCVSYGEYLESDIETYTIIMERSDDELTKQVFPKGCITKIELLTAKRAKK